MFLRPSEIILCSVLLTIVASSYCDSKKEDVKQPLDQNNLEGWLGLGLIMPTRIFGSKNKRFESIDKYGKPEDEVDESSRISRQKRGMMGLFGLVTKRPQHRLETDLLFPPPKDTFMSSRGKKSRLYFSQYSSVVK